MQDQTLLNIGISHKLHLKRALSLLWKAAPGWTLVSTILLGLQAGLPLLQLYLMKLMIDAVTAGLAAPDKSAAFGKAFFFICLMGAASLAAVFLASIARVVGQAQAEVVTDHVQNVIHGKSVAIDLGYYENSRFYDTLHRAQQEAPHRPTSIVNGLVQILQNLFTLIGIAALLFSCHWGVAVALFLSVVPGLFLRLRLADILYKWQFDRSTLDRTTAYLNWLLTAQFYAKEIRIFDLGTLFIQRYRNLRQQLRQEKITIAFKHALNELGAETAAILVIFGSLAFIVYRAVQGIMTLGDMVMYYQAFQRGQAYFRDMLNGLAGLYEDNLFLSNFYEFLDLKPMVIEPPRPVPVPRPIKKGIVFTDVGFRYPTGEAMVLENINLTILPGQMVALVGENGSGKTTLLKLLCRLYDPTTGSITLDGIDLRHFESTTLRREFSIIFQDYVKYQMTARENIWVGNTVLPPDDEKIIAAAKYSGAHGILNKLPKGYETMLGKWFGEGEELSIGQWQNVALARAFLRDAQFIALDEPTSSMDAKAEYAVFRNFRKLAAGRTAILISHRFSTIKMADRIFVLEGGRITEGGTHDELMGNGKTYAHLFEVQAKYYK